jgi:synaptobrevin family protein YKT6
MLLKEHNTTKKPIVLAQHIDAGDSWSAWLYSGTLKEMAMFISKLLTEKTQPGYRQQVEQKENIGYVHKKIDGCTCVLITDKDYPLRVAFDIVRKTQNDFAEFLHKQNKNIKDANIDNCFAQFNANLKQTLETYQDPTKGDSLLKVKKDLEETKEVLHQALEKLLDRGDKIDNLIERSDELSSSSKEFYRRTKDSKCCTIL